ncbi:MAG: hypothetical protein GXZ19_04280 [Bacteroidales bacterium]|nr:hypothetical protein [Bacteroidales bacterium]
MKKLAAFLLGLLLLSCSKQEHHSYTFYYWRTQLSLNDVEKDALNRADVPALYLRFFDVDRLDGKIQPVALVNKDSSFVSDKEIVPVVFITNRTLYNISSEEIQYLAEELIKLVERRAGELSLNMGGELQIDCDWTAGTRDDFFLLLERLKELSGLKVTSTLRLHQVKDRHKMGVPPVDKVYLMCYSTSSPLEDSDKNSILDLSLLKNYLRELQRYPIQNIDIALPIFSWGIVTNHIGQHRLINGLSKTDLNSPGLRKIAENRAEVVEDGFYFGHFLNSGFMIKTEEIDAAQLDEAVQFINNKIPKYNIIYYQLSSGFVDNKNLLR